MEEQIVEMLVKLYPKTEITEMTPIRKILIQTIDEANLSERTKQAILSGATRRFQEEDMTEMLKKRPMNDKKAIHYLIEMLKENWLAKDNEDLIQTISRW